MRKAKRRRPSFRGPGYSGTIKGFAPARSRGRVTMRGPGYTAKAASFARSLEKRLRRLRTYLLRLKALMTRNYAIGWDTILDRTEAAILRCCPGMFRRELSRIEGLRRRYEGYKMPGHLAIEPAERAIGRTERALGMRRR